MNPSQHRELSDPDDHLLDRLVDGDLPEDERQGLLWRLESSPDGWRRCALAFLEAQTWRSVSVELMDSLKPVESASLPVLTLPPSPAPAVRRAAGLFVRAACLLAVFGLGVASARLTWPREPAPSDGSTPLPSTIAATDPAPRAGEAAEQGATPEPPSAEAVAGESMAMADPPAVGTPAVDESRVSTMREVLARRGYEIVPSVGYAPVVTDGGRMINVPVTSTYVRYVGNRVY